MAADLDQLEDWVGGLVARLAPAERRKLARAIAVDLRRGQQQRIADQKNPDGSPFAPRKKRGGKALRAKAGRIKRRATAKAKAGSMFAKLRKSQYLRADASPSEASVGFSGNATARVARVHQEGLRDRVSRKRGAPEVTYPVRQLLGVADDDRARMLDLVITHLGV
jgi:phage virion morphogenesis protein